MALIFVEGGGLPSKGRYGCVGPGIRYFKGQFLPGNLVLGGKFCLSIIGFWQFFTKCVIFDKSDLLAENFQHWHSKVHENLPNQ